MAAIDDFRSISKVDISHGDMSDIPDRWFERSKFVTLSESTDDGTPLVAVNLRYPEPCLIDSTADMRIVHWLANLEVNRRLLERAFVRSIEAINAHMIEVGATRVWGMVPKKAEHLTAFLDRVAAAGRCQRIDGATISTGQFEGNAPEHVYFYIGLGQKVTDFMAVRR